jgi:hypothetical protein
MARTRLWLGTRISTLLAGLTLTALSISPSTSSSAAPAAPPTATAAAIPHAAPARPRRRPPEVEGCFVPPPEPVEVPPCDAGQPSR